MRRLLVLSCALFLYACTLQRPGSVQTKSASGGAATGDIVSPFEATPQTHDSLEVAVNRSGAVIPMSRGASGSVILGSPESPRLLLITDPACRYCRDFQLGDRQWLEERYIATGKLSLEILYLPMDSAGDLMARALLCAADQNKFEAMEDSLTTDPIYTPKELPSLAKKAGLKTKDFLTCVDSKLTRQLLSAQALIAKSLGIERVPGFRIDKAQWIGIESRSVLRQKIEEAF